MLILVNAAGGVLLSAEAGPQASQLSAFAFVATTGNLTDLGHNAAEVDGRAIGSDTWIHAQGHLIVDANAANDDGQRSVAVTAMLPGGGYVTAALDVDFASRNSALNFQVNDPVLSFSDLIYRIDMRRKSRWARAQACSEFRTLLRVPISPVRRIRRWTRRSRRRQFGLGSSLP